MEYYSDAILDVDHPRCLPECGGLRLLEKITGGA